MEVKRLSVSLRPLLPPLSLSLPSLGEIGNGAVIEVLKPTRCGLRHARNRDRASARNVRAAVKFLFIPLTRQLRPLGDRASRTYAAADTRFFFPLCARARARARTCVQAACVTNRRGDVSHPVITSRISIRRSSTKGDCQLRKIFALQLVRCR